jgi:hypothetical protein
VAREEVGDTCASRGEGIGYVEARFGISVVHCFVKMSRLVGARGQKQARRNRGVPRSVCTRRRARRHDVAVERRAAREGREKYVSLDLATRRVVFRRVTSDHHPHAPRFAFSSQIRSVGFRSAAPRTKRPRAALTPPLSTDPPNPQF